MFHYLSLILYNKLAEIVGKISFSLVSLDSLRFIKLVFVEWSESRTRNFLAMKELHWETNLGNQMLMAVSKFRSQQQQQQQQQHERETEEARRSDSPAANKVEGKQQQSSEAEKDEIPVVSVAAATAKSSTSAKAAPVSAEGCRIRRGAASSSTTDTRSVNDEHNILRFYYTICGRGCVGVGKWGE